MTYLWQHPDWPQFTYDITELCASTLYQYAQSVSRLSFNLQSVQEDLRLDAMLDLMVEEAIKSSAIEGEKLSYNDVRSSLKNHLGLTYPPDTIRDPRARGIAALMINNYQQHDKTLSADTLFQWHRMLLPHHFDTWGRTMRVGQWRVEGMEVVSGSANKQKIHFEAPPADIIPQEMEQFFNWYNHTNPLQLAPTQPLIVGPIRAALAHLWFVTIHPFDDGNGRLARAISDHALAQDSQHPMLHSLSTAIEKNRRDYYAHLEATQAGSMNVTTWVQWFLSITCEAITITEKLVNFTLEKAAFMQRHQHHINERQLKVLLYLFSNGAEGDARSINRNKYVQQTHCSPRTALRDLKDLVAKDALVRLPALGRNTRYGLNI